eukprot:gene25322-30576_t
MKGLDPAVEGQVEQIEKQVEGRGTSGGQSGGGKGDVGKKTTGTGGDRSITGREMGRDGHHHHQGVKDERKEKEGEGGSVGDERFKKWKTPLQRHVAYFDLNNDGYISPHETFQGLRRLGFGLLFALIGVLVINGSMSYPSCNSIVPDPFFRINIQNISRCKHGSDTGVYDMEGNFNEQKFGAMVDKYDVDKKGGVSFREGLKMMRDRRNIYDFFGWFAESFEWGFTYVLLANNKGVVPTDTLRSMFDGTLFFEMEKKNRGRHGVARAT